MLHVNIPVPGNKLLKRRSEPSSSSEVRPLQPAHVPEVARLFQKTFRSPGKAAPASLLDYLEEIFLNHPWQDSQQISKVIIDGEGAVAGFIGVLPQRLIYGDTIIRASVLGSLMSNDVQRNPLIGAKLLRSALNGPQDLSISESANSLSLNMWEKTGGITLPPFSLSWVRILKPVTLPFAMLAGRLPVASVFVPMMNRFDRMADWLTSDLFSIGSDGPQGQDYAVGADEFAAAIPALCTRYRIRPLWNEQILSWLLEHAASKRHFGSLAMRLVKGKANRIVGGYIYYGKRCGVAFVLQVFAEPDAERLVVNSLVHHAAASGFAALRGRVQPEFLDALARQKSILFRRSGTVVHTRNDRLRTSLLTETALLTGLAAEAWTKLIGEEFS